MEWDVGLKMCIVFGGKSRVIDKRSTRDPRPHHEVGPTALMSKLVTVRAFLLPKIGDNQLLLSFDFLRLRGEADGVDVTDEVMDDVESDLDFDDRMYSSKDLDAGPPEL